MIEKECKNPDLVYIKKCAEENGIKVTKETAFTVHFIADIMRAMNRKMEQTDGYHI